MKTLKIVSFVVTLFFISGCSTVSITNDYDPTVSFSGYHTYQWLPEKPEKTGDSRIDGNSILQSRIVFAVDSALASQGYKKVTSGTADFLVTYHVTLDQKTQVDTLNTYNGYGGGWGWDYGMGYYPGLDSYSSEVFVYTYDEGSLIVDIIDPADNKLVWRGSATDEVNFSSSPEDKHEKLNAAVKQMLEKFPPH